MHFVLPGRVRRGKTLSPGAEEHIAERSLGRPWDRPKKSATVYFWAAENHGDFVDNLRERLSGSVVERVSRVSTPANNGAPDRLGRLPRSRSASHARQCRRSRWPVIAFDRRPARTPKPTDDNEVRSPARRSPATGCSHCRGGIAAAVRGRPGAEVVQHPAAERIQ